MGLSSKWEYLIKQIYDKNLENIVPRDWCTLGFVKKVRGKDRDGKTKKFYDEREWRYVPHVDKLNNNIQVFKSGDSPSFDKENELTRDYIIEINPDMIRYIIIKNECERKGMVNFITGKMGVDTKFRHLLVSKILTLEQIREDF